MKNFLQKTCLLVLMLVMGASAAWADWTRCTSVSDLTSGGTFIIGYEATANSGKIVPMKNSGGTATATTAGYMAAYTTGIDMAKVTSTADYEISIVASTKVKDAVCIKIGDNYLGNTNTKNNCKLFTEESATTAFGVSVGTNDVFTLKIAENSTYHTLQYNSSAGSERFAVYGGTQKNLVIYKKAGGSTGGDTGGTVTPQKQQYTISYDAELTNGAVMGPTKGYENDVISLTAVPYDGYKLSAWNVKNLSNNETVHVNNNKFTMPAANVFVSAIFGASTEDAIVSNITLGNDFWGTQYNGTISDVIGNAFTQSGTQDDISVTLFNGASTNGYITDRQTRCYNNYTLTFSIPEGYVFSEIVFTTGDKWVAPAASVGVIDGKTWTSNSNREVTFTFSGTSIITNVEVSYVLGNDSGETGGEGGDTGGGTLSPIPNFIQNATVEIALNSDPYDVRQDLNIPKDAYYTDYSITTSIDGKSTVEDTYACVYSVVTFKKTGTYVVHVVAPEVAGKYAQTEGDITIMVYDPNEPSVDPDEPTSNVYDTLAELVAALKPESTARKVTVTLTDEEITKIFVTAKGYRNGVYVQVGEQEIEIYCQDVPEAWVVGGTVSGTLTDCDWKLYNSTWELCPTDWSELQYTAPTEVEVQQYAVTYTAPEHGTLVVMNGEEQLTSGAQVNNGTRVTLEITPDAGYEFEKWEAVEDGAVKYTCTSDRRYYDVTKDVEFKAYFREAFVEPAGEKVTWDLSIDETTTASDTKLMWRNTIAMMEADKATSSTATNNYYPGTTGKEYTSTRFYTNSTLTVTPAKGITINAVVAECTTSDYTSKLVGSVWTNATVKNFGTKVVITPTDGTAAVSAVLSGTTGATAVTVYYTGTSQGWPEVTTYDVNVDEKVVGGTISASAESAEAGTTITLTATPADGYEFTSWNVTLVDDDSAVTVKDNKFTMPEGDVNVSAVFTAQEVTPDVPSEHTFVAEEVWGSTSKQAATMSGTQNGCTMLCKKAPSSSQNCNYVVAANNPNDMRVYAGGTVTLFNLTGMSQVVFNISTQGLKRLAPITVDSGTIAYDVENATVTWTATTPVKTVTFTVGEKAEYGSEGATKAGQLDFTSYDVVEAAAQGEIRDVAKYIDGLNLEVEAFSVEELQIIIDSALGK